MKLNPLAVKWSTIFWLILTMLINLFCFTDFGLKKWRRLWIHKTGPAYLKMGLFV